MPLTARRRLSCPSLCLMLALPPVWAQGEAPAPTQENAVPDAPVAPPAPAAPALPAAPAAAASAATASGNGNGGWEGALGLILNHQPSYSGSGEMINKLVPSFYLRRGRFSITNASVFVTRRQDDVLRGVSADLVRSDTLRVNLALRLDNGRRQDESDRLNGLGNVKRTVRGRLSGSWRFAENWRLSMGLSPDLFNRGGGVMFDSALAREFRLGPHSAAALGASMSYGNARYMQSYYGVTEAQAARTGYAVYRPTAGFNNTAVSVSWRGDINERWTAFSSAGASRLRGPALDSPLVKGASSWSVSGGLAWRF